MAYEHLSIDQKRRVIAGALSEDMRENWDQSDFYGLLMDGSGKPLKKMTKAQIEAEWHGLTDDMEIEQVQAFVRNYAG